MEKIRFAIMGAANIAKRFVNAVQYAEGAEIVTVASRDPARGRAFMQACGLPAHDSYESMLNREDVDAVYIATTQNMHKENVLACLEHGKHVLCEKAMTLSQADAEEVFEKAKEKGLFLMEAMWSRFLPNIRRAKQWVESGKIGSIQSAYASIGFKSTLPLEGRIHNPALGGGGMYDIGVYAIEVLTYLMGEKITDVKSVTRRSPLTGVDERVTMILSFDSAEALADVSVTSNVRQVLMINGSEGTIEIPDFHVGNTSMLRAGDGKLIEQYTEPFPGGNGFVYEIEETVRCIREGKTTSETVPPETTIECGWVFDRVLRG